MSWDGKATKYGAFLVEGIDDLVHFGKLAGVNFVYRGQSNYEWPLQTKLERDISDSIREAPGLDRYEEYALEQFKRRAHLYMTASEQPKREDDTEWLSFIQHYGGPTRLLDFTRSVFIAAYFAIGHGNKADAAVVYAINTRPLAVTFWERAAEYVKLYGNKGGQSDVAMLKDSIAQDRCIPGVVVFNPKKQNRRLLQQQGLFVAPVSLSLSFQENLFASLHGPVRLPSTKTGHCDELKNAKSLRSETSFNEYAVIRLLIPKASYNRRDLGSIRDLLGQMNLSADTLYPDLQGQMLALEELMPRSTPS